jgi:pSer/pThr/pTyr-binding forkhead associated (FHA) protein
MADGWPSFKSSSDRLSLENTMDPNKTQMAAPPTADPNKTMLGGPTLDATQTIKPVQCPVCKTFNPVGVMFCVDCGLIFERALDGDAFGAPAVQLPLAVEAVGGKEHVLRFGLTVLGRQGDIVTEDTRVSRRHAQIGHEAGRLWIEDLGSTNGTQVNGERLNTGEQRDLVPGDVVSLGGFELRIADPSEALKTQLPASGKTTMLTAAPTVGEIVARLVGSGFDLPLKEGANTFGRKPDNDCQIADPYVSGRHGTIEIVQGEVFLTDVGSTNGTIVNDARLPANQRTLLQPHDVIKLGQLELRVVSAQSDEPASTE